MAEAIIGVLGAGLLGLLGLFLQAIRSDLRSLGERMDAGFAGTEEILADVRERLAAIETTQAEHGRLLGHMMGHGERIAALEGAAGAG